MKYDVTMKTRTNLCRNIGVHYDWYTKPLNGVSIRKNVSCGSFYNTEADKCFIFGSHFHRTRTAHQEKIKSINECRGPVKQQKKKRIIAIIFLSISLNICFGYSKEPSHRDGSFEYHNICFG